MVRIPVGFEARGEVVNIISRTARLSPIYQAILTISNSGIPDGDPTSSLFEPLLAWISGLMAVYEK